MRSSPYDFKTSNGPDVHIYIVAADDAKDNATVKRAGFTDLREIKGNIGDQNYALGPDVDLAKYRGCFHMGQVVPCQLRGSIVDARLDVRDHFFF